MSGHFCPPKLLHIPTVLVYIQDRSVKVHFWNNWACRVCVCIFFIVDMDADENVMEEDNTSLINVSDGLWLCAAVGRLSVSRPSSQAAQ